MPSTTIPITIPQARLELALWQAETDLVSNSDFYLQLRELGLPSEVAIRLKELLEIVKPIGDKVISIGKIIALKLIDFVKKHPNLAVGIALGAAVFLLVSLIPFLGPLLSPIALTLGITIGAVAGHRLDKAQGGKTNSDLGFIDAVQDVIEIARSFFQLFIDTLMAISADSKL